MDPRHSFSGFNRHASLASRNFSQADRSVSPVDSDWAHKKATPTPPSPPQAAYHRLTPSQFGMVKRTGQGQSCHVLVPRVRDVQVANDTSNTRGTYGQIYNRSNSLNRQSASAGVRSDHGDLAFESHINGVYNAVHAIPGGGHGSAATEGSYNSAATNDTRNRMNLSQYVDAGDSQPTANREGVANQFFSIADVGNAELLPYVGSNMEMIHDVRTQGCEVPATQNLAYPLSDPDFQLSQEGNYDVQPSGITFDDVHPSAISLGQINALFDEMLEQKAGSSPPVAVMGPEADLGRDGGSEDTTLANQTLSEVNEDMKKGVIARDRISHEDMPHAQIADEGASDCKMTDSHITDDKTEEHNAVDRSTCVPVTTQPTIDQSPLVDDLAVGSIVEAEGTDNDVKDEKIAEASGADGRVEEGKIINSEVVTTVTDSMTEANSLEKDASSVNAPDGDVADVEMSDDRLTGDRLPEPKVEDQEMTDQVGVGEVLNEKTSGIEIGMNSSAESQAHAIASKPLVMPNDETESPNMMQPATEPRTTTSTAGEIVMAENIVQASTEKKVVTSSQDVTDVVMEEEANQKTPQGPVRNPAFLVPVDEAKIARIAAEAQDLRAMFGALPAVRKKRPLSRNMKQSTEKHLPPAITASAQAVVQDTTEPDLATNEIPRTSSRVSSLAASPLRNARPSPLPSSSRPLTEIMKQVTEKHLPPATTPSAQAVVQDTKESALTVNDISKTSSQGSSLAASPPGNARPSPLPSSRRAPVRRRNGNFDLEFPDFNRSFRAIGSAIRDLGAENDETHSKLILAREKLKENEQRFKDNERKLNGHEKTLKKHEKMLEKKDSEIAILKKTLDGKIEKVKTDQHKWAKLYEKLAASEAKKAQAAGKAKEGEKAKEAEKTKETKRAKVTKKAEEEEDEEATDEAEASKAAEAKRTRSSTKSSGRGGNVQSKRGGRGGNKK